LKPTRLVGRRDFRDRTLLVEPPDGGFFVLFRKLRA